MCWTHVHRWLIPNFTDAFLILLSGLTLKLLDGGLDALRDYLLGIQKSDMQEQSPQMKHPTILPGSGINFNTVAQVVKTLWPLGITEYHLSGGREQAQPVPRKGKQPASMRMGPNTIWMTESDVVLSVRNIAETVIHELDD